MGPMMRSYLQLGAFSRIRMRASIPRESKRCNTDGRSVWTAGRLHVCQPLHHSQHMNFSAHPRINIKFILTCNSPILFLSCSSSSSILCSHCDILLSLSFNSDCFSLTTSSSFVRFSRLSESAFSLSSSFFFIRSSLPRFEASSFPPSWKCNTNC